MNLIFLYINVFVCIIIYVYKVDMYIIILWSMYDIFFLNIMYNIIYYATFNVIFFEKKILIFRFETTKHKSID